MGYLMYVFVDIFHDGFEPSGCNGDDRFNSIPLPGLQSSHPEALHRTERGWCHVVMTCHRLNVLSIRLLADRTWKLLLKRREPSDATLYHVRNAENFVVRTCIFLSFLWVLFFPLLLDSCSAGVLCPKVACIPCAKQVKGRRVVCRCAPWKVLDSPWYEVRTHPMSMSICQEPGCFWPVSDSFLTRFLTCFWPVSHPFLTCFWPVSDLFLTCFWPVPGLFPMLWARCVSTLCVSTMWEHSMCEQHVWALYVWPL